MGKMAHFAGVVAFIICLQTPVRGDGVKWFTSIYYSNMYQEASFTMPLFDAERENYKEMGSGRSNGFTLSAGLALPKNSGFYLYSLGVSYVYYGEIEDITEQDGFTESGEYEVQAYKEKLKSSAVSFDTTIALYLHERVSLAVKGGPLLGIHSLHTYENGNSEIDGTSGVYLGVYGGGGIYVMLLEKCSLLVEYQYHRAFFENIFFAERMKADGYLIGVQYKF